MSQLFVVQGSDPKEVATLSSRAQQLFDCICSLRPNDCFLVGSASVMTFPRLQPGRAKIVRQPSSNSWICGAGTFFYSGSTGEAALSCLIEKTAAGDDIARHLENMDGSFALVLGNSRTDEVVAITDRLGTLHLYTASHGSCQILTTSSLILAVLLKPSWDMESCREFIAMGTIFEQRTLFQGITKIEPATIYRTCRGRVRSRDRYWDIAGTICNRSANGGNAFELAEALQDSVTRIAKAFPNPAFDLTGGLDSRAVVSAALKVIGNSFQAVVVGNKDDADVATARTIARAAGIRLMQIEHGTSGPEWWESAKQCLSLCDGEYNVLEYARILDVHTKLKDSFDVTVNGSNGELCKGYWWELLFPFTGWRGHFDARKIAASRFVLNVKGADFLDYRYEADLVSHFAGVIDRANACLGDCSNTLKLDNVYLNLRTQRWQGRIASSTDRIWPCVSPFMFRAPMEIALSARPSTRVRNRMSRRLIEALRPDLAALPLAEGYPALPVRPSTLPLFAPFTGELLHKVSRRLRLTRSRNAVAGGVNVIRPLWQEEEIQELLTPTWMMSGELYRKEKLEDFLNQSRQETFADTSLFGRVLTLELVARARQTRRRPESVF